RAVSDEEDEQLILFGELLAELGEHPLDLLARRLLDALALGLRQHDEPVVRVAELLAEEMGEGDAPRLVLLRVGGSAGSAADDQSIFVARKRRARKEKPEHG